MDVIIAKIAGLAEGVHFWGPQEHQWEDLGVCARCYRSRQETIGTPCYKPTPDYSNSMDLLLPVVRKVCQEDKVRERFVYKLGWKLFDLDDKDDSTWLGTLLLKVDNPAQLLADALIEAVGEKE